MIGIIGIGAMGYGVAGTFLREFRDVMVYDIDEARVASAEKMGATAAANPGELVGCCDPVFLSLPKSHILVDVIESGVLPAVTEEQTVIDLGTTVAEETRRLCAEFEKKGAWFIDAPVSGGPIGSSTGTLFIFVGGDREAAKRQWPLLKSLGKSRLTYCGPSGAGQITKAVNQLAMGLSQAAFIEAVAYGANAGVDPSVLVNAVGDKAGFRGQFSGVASRIVGGLGDQMDCKYAEFDYFLAESEHAGFPMPMLEALNSYMKKFPEDARDNMGRPFPPLWSALTEKSSEDTPDGSTGGDE